MFLALHVKGSSQYFMIKNFIFMFSLYFYWDLQVYATKDYENYAKGQTTVL